ncbi:MAG: alpha/beta fold hydrolase [Burkholderiales bacterium]|nr:alpha/beta fold hydrolase [Burkholderiales bacterium]
MKRQNYIGRLFAILLASVFVTSDESHAQMPEQATQTAIEHPVAFSLWTAALSNLLNWNSTPPGINPATCRVKENQNPVILVHGTFANMMLAFSAIGPSLANEGYCVYAMNYGAKSAGDWIHALAPMETSAQVLADKVEEVRALTGAEKVDLIGHSQGGTLIHYYAKVLKGSRNVDKLIAIAPSLRGTDRVSADTPYEYCIACGQQHPKSEIIRKINDGPVRQETNRVFVLATRNDWIVRPVESQFIQEAGAENVLLQDKFPGKWATHSGILYDKDAIELIKTWLKTQNLKF